MRCPAGQSGSDCSTGSATQYTWQDAKDFCDNLNYADHDDWRLPEIHELESIVDYSNPDWAIDSTAFPATPDFFWSSLSVVGNTSLAWYVSFYDGIMCYNYNTYGYDVRCVRGGPLVMGSFESSVISGERVVRDEASGLEWQGCPAGQSGSDCSTGSATHYNWQEATDYCDNLTWAGYSDWRLPNFNELVSIVDYTTYKPAINTTAFPATPNDYFLSSSSCVHDTSDAYNIDLNDGIANGFIKTVKNDIRCVREDHD
jgi:hypothetical protein